jgi:integrase
MVRQFARWVHAIDPRHQIPPPRLLGVRHRRNPPHIYSDEEIAALMAEAAKLDSDTGMRSLNLETIIGLLAATGLRPGEAFALQRKDVDLQAGVLMIRESKFGKSRQVPIHPSTVRALKHYVRRCDQMFCHPGESCFFLSDDGTALEASTVRRWFCQISRNCGLREKSAGHRCGRGPRLQDLRHSYACRILIRWSKHPVILNQRVLWLMHYLGHTQISHTYWYLSAIPELLAQAAVHFEKHSKR